MGGNQKGKKRTAPPRRARRAGEDCVTELARACVEARAELRRASGALHDRIGSALAAAGLQLQLLRMDSPEFAVRSEDVLQLLNGVMDEVRQLSRNLDPTPVHRAGLKNALLDLARADAARVEIRYGSTAAIPALPADALYLAAARTVGAALRRDVKRVTVSASGSKCLTLRIRHDGRASDARRDLAAAAVLARAAGLSFAIETEKSTIVLIRYALRRSTGG